LQQSGRGYEYSYFDCGPPWQFWEPAVTFGYTVPNISLGGKEASMH